MKSLSQKVQTILPFIITLATLGALIIFPGILRELTAGVDQTGNGSMTGEERVYTAILRTRKTQLSGKNPVIGVFYTSDGGETWTHTGWKQGKTAGVTTVPGGSGDTIFTASGNGAMRTTDGGDFWKITTGWKVTEAQDVVVNPGRITQVFAATPYGIFRSDNLGDSWREYSTGLPSKFVGSIRVDRTDPDRVFAGTEEGLCFSEDAGAHWKSLPLRDPVRSIRQSPVNPDRWAVGLQDRGVAVSRDGGNTWHYTGGEIGHKTIYECEFAPRNPDGLVAGGWSTGVYRSNDFGDSWEQLMPQKDTLSVHSLAISRKNPDRIFAGSMGEGIFRTEDGGKTWEKTAPKLFDAAQVWDLYIEGEQ